MQTPGTKGDYTLHRVVTGADDPATLKHEAAVNMTGYRYALIQAVPIDTDAPPKDVTTWPGTVALGASDPTFDVYYWCPVVGLYVRDHSWTPPTFTAAKGAAVTVEVNERNTILVLKNAPTASEAVAFLIAGQRAVELL